MGVLKSLGKVLDFFVTKRMGTLFVIDQCNDVEDCMLVVCFLPVHRWISRC